MSTTDHSLPTQPLELTTTTTAPTQPPEPLAKVEGLSTAEAAAAFGLSVSTVRRLIIKGNSKGLLTGVVKVSTAKGIELRIPPASLEALGYTAKATQSGAILNAARANLEAEQLAAKVSTLEATLALEVVRRESAETELVAVRENLNDLREALAKLPKVLEAPKRRGFFRRGH